MFFASCLVIQLCNINQKTRTFQINVLIKFFLCSTCFEHLMFIIRKTKLYMQPYMVFFHAFIQEV